MKRLLAGFCLSLGLANAASAAVFSEDFNNPTFVGSPILTFGSSSDSASSDRWANTNYYTINNGVNGWTFGNSGTYLAEQTNAAGVPTGDGALLLNENGGVATNIVGLTVGQTYNINLLLSGDNRPGSAYAFNIAIGPSSWVTLGVDGTAGSNPGTLETYTFVAANTSETLWLSQSSPSQASPIVDNISITAIPEPSTWAMMILGFAGMGFMAYRKRRDLSLRIA